MIGLVWLCALSSAHALLAPLPRPHRTLRRSHVRLRSLERDDAAPPPPLGEERDEAVRESSSVAIAEALAAPRYEVFSAGITLLSCALFAVTTLPDLAPELAAALESGELGLSIFFLVEFVARWYARDLEPKFLVEFLSLVDLVSFLPTFLAFLPIPALSFLRLLRVLRLKRLLNDAEAFRAFRASAGLSAKAGDPARDEIVLQLARVASSLFALLFVASGLIYSAEHEVNDAIPDFFTALYFGLTTLTTVGFGDIVPVTFAGRVIVSGSVLVGIGVIPLQLTTLAETLLRSSPGPAASPRPRGLRLDRLPVQCGNCGEKAHRKDAAFCFRCGVGLPDGDA
jgi:voltage-gated potassium channel